jgi:hypothetical protein
MSLVGAKLQLSNYKLAQRKDLGVTKLELSACEDRNTGLDDNGWSRQANLKDDIGSYFCTGRKISQKYSAPK